MGTITEGNSGDILDRLRDGLPHVDADPASGHRFPGGAVGMMSYESGFPGADLPVPSDRDDGPRAWFGIYDTFARHDESGGVVEVISWGLDAGGTFDANEARRRASELEETLRHGAQEPWDGSAEIREVRASLTRETHGRGVERILEHIRAGDVYQANLTVQFEVRTERDPLDLFERLVKENAAPFATYLETVDGTIVSCSPERLLSARGRRVETRPIKGTAARHPDPIEDARRAAALSASAKDRAELLMITDLLRNDLGKVCAPGSIRVARLRELKSFPHVHHLVSTIEGRLVANRDVFDALTAVFPCGSITGAPKRRAMEILHDLEPVTRGVYTGTVGWVGFDRNADFSVAIRTGMHRNGTFTFGAGGGIVADSTADEEWRELLVKARAFALALDVDLERARERSLS